MTLPYAPLELKIFSMNFIFIILIGICCYFLGTLVWNFILKKILEGNFFPRIFKKKVKNEPPDGLKKALQEGLITEEELLRLQLERAEKNLKEYLSGKK